MKGGQAVLSDAQGAAETAPQAVFICNSPLHVYNAMQAVAHWGLQAEQCILVLKVVNEQIQLPALLEEQARWQEIVRIESFPVYARLKERGFFKRRLVQHRFFRDWQKRLQGAVGCRYVFLCHNRQEDNQVIASYLKARELVWLEDGTLSYFLWQEERLVPSGTRKERAAAAARNSAREKVGGKKAGAKKSAGSHGKGQKG